MKTQIILILSNVEDILMNWIIDHIPTLGALFVAAWVTWWFRGKLGHYQNRFVNAELACTKLEIIVSELSKRLDRTERKLDSLTIQLAVNKQIDPDAIHARSPLELTESGAEILEKMGGKAYVDLNLAKLIDKIEKRNPKSALDVQDDCIILFWNQMDENEMVPIKNFVYQNPNCRTSNGRTISLNLMTAICLMSVYLRNLFLERHPEIYKIVA